ncbi:MAG: hypothetical protein PW845_19500 [Pseudomonas sp.]|uniref:PA0061/PA0062 family lipoprotein n=1 Tax=Pseudomonas abieticivorans TaxID=2931382 RepID=UPI0020C11D26|nr:hypothetical protein [Pseudomonas sp. PIA16]MDE1167493.1 hypothetical protein [Pseudomonas sp.]
MRRPLLLLCLALVGGCASPLPAKDPQQAWVDMTMIDGKVVMAERLDGERLRDGRYFQVTPGAHKLIVRYDYEISQGGMFFSDPGQRLCYLTIHYDGFKAGQRYLIETRTMGLTPMARLYDPQRKIVAEDSDVNCLL